ncbi:MAG: hypothetical protein KGH75_00035 [Rhodospirillales bacterium]|nr:hypothetical protein [Rhodospirillales bacterium]
MTDDETGPPTFWLDEDGEHVWWSHWCPRAFHWTENPGRRLTVMLPLGGAGWTLVDREPLHVEPSIFCVPPKGCGAHGFIRNGTWEAV